MLITFQYKHQRVSCRWSKQAIFSWCTILIKFMADDDNGGSAQRQSLILSWKDFGRRHAECWSDLEDLFKLNLQRGNSFCLFLRTNVLLSSQIKLKYMKKKSLLLTLKITKNNAFSYVFIDKSDYGQLLLLNEIKILKVLTSLRIRNT